MATVYDFLNADSSEVEEQRVIRVAGTTGDVLTLQANGTVSPAPGGGSQTMKAVDLGTITAAAVAASGPQLLYTPAAGELVFGSLMGNGTFCDVGQRVGIATLANLPANDDGLFFAYFDNDLFAAQWIQQGLAGGTSPSSWDVPPYVTAPLYAGWFTGNNDLLVDTAAGAWQASHAFALNAWIIDSNGHLQHATTGGTSKSGSHPVWATDGSTTDDGSVQWTDEGLAPTAGQVDMTIMVATPAAP